MPCRGILFLPSGANGVACFVLPLRFVDNHVPIIEKKQSVRLVVTPIFIIFAVER